MFKRISIPLACVALGGMQCAWASSDEQGQWVTTFLAGTQFRSSSTLQSGGTGNIADLGQLNPTLAGDSGVAKLGHVSMHDAFRMGPSFGLETGYMASSNVEPFARLTFAQMRGRTARLGFLTSPALAVDGVVKEDFDDQNSWALDVGMRLLADTAGAARPFVTGFIGVDRTDELRASMFIPGIANPGPRTLLPRETKLNGGIEGGVNVQLSSQADLNFSVGADYMAARHGRTNALEALGLDRVQLNDERWTFPVDVGVNYRF